MTDKQKEGKFLQSYLYTEGSNYFISTIYRKSSAILASDLWYFETFAWTLKEDGTRDKWVEQNDGAITEKGAIEQHLQTISKLNGEEGKDETKTI